MVRNSRLFFFSTIRVTDWKFFFHYFFSYDPDFQPVNGINPNKPQDMPYFAKTDGFQHF
jgi:hypothetical protein